MSAMWFKTYELILASMHLSGLSLLLV